MGSPSCAERMELETSEADGILPAPSSDYGFIKREDLRMFLVACLQASVSVETMSRYLGLDEATVRAELRAGIEAWNAGKRRTVETPDKPHLTIAASRD